MTHGFLLDLGSYFSASTLQEYCLGSESFLTSSGILDLAPFFNPAAFIALTFSSPASFLQLFL